MYPDPAKSVLKRRPEYDDRLVFECNTIVQMGFPGYFLIVADFINWAKNNGVPVGPGRGSGAGSLVAYSLRITDLDPLPMRCCSSASSIRNGSRCPTSISTSARTTADRVIDYVQAGKYGARRGQSQIATFGTLGVEGRRCATPAACSTCHTTKW